MSENKKKKQTDLSGSAYLQQCIRKERRRKDRHRLYRDLIVTSVLVFILFQVILGVAVIQKDSMSPNLTEGSIALFLRLDSHYKCNDIVIFRSAYNNELLIKRIVAVAGDKIEIDEETGTLYVNGIANDPETIVGKTYSREHGVTFPLTVPNGCVFVMGDNREVSLDSRDFGSIDIRKIIGKVFFEIKRV